MVVFSGLLMVMLLAALDSTNVSTALPTIEKDLGWVEHLEWVVTAYLFAQTVVTPVYGKLGDLSRTKAHPPDEHWCSFSRALRSAA